MAVASAEANNPEGQNLPATEVNAGLPAQVGDNFPVTEEESNVIVARFRALSRARQLQLIISLAAAIAMMVAIYLWSSEPNYKLLYGKISVQSASDIAQVLDQDGIKYQYDSSSGQIKVPAANLDDVRLKLAAKGLPKEDGTGFELLDKTQSFGTSQFMEKARYHRALEGELARTISSFSAVESARVHLAIPKQSVFIRNRQLPSASVMVSIVPGQVLDESQVQAIVHLVASSIPELKPGKVTVVDQEGKLLSKRELSGEMAMSTAQFDYKRKLENYYVDRIERILTPIVGFEGARAQVDAELDFTATEKTQESYNPDLPALRSEHTQSEESKGGDVGGVPGALTNQPPGVATVPETPPKTTTSSSTGPTRKSQQATYNYELDKTISHSKQAPGIVRRLSVAVVVDNKSSFDSKGNVVRTALSPEELDRMSKLIKDAVGFNPSRGDSINVINAPFKDSEILPKKPLGPLWEQDWFINIAKQVVGIFAILFFIVLVLRPVIRELTYKEPEEVEVEEETVEEEFEKESDIQKATGMSESQWEELGVTPEEYEEMLEELRRITADDPRIVAQVVKTWVALDEEL